MRVIGNIIWWLFGGLEAAAFYFAGTLVLSFTIIGTPFAMQTYKMGLLCLWPFGTEVRESESRFGCLRFPLGLLWLVFGGLGACIMHLVFGVWLCFTLVGIPFGRKHFRLARLALWPFGKTVEL